MHTYCYLSRQFIFSGHVNADSPYGLSDLKFLPLAVENDALSDENRNEGYIVHRL